jgi:hypothetical protein
MRAAAPHHGQPPVLTMSPLPLLGDSTSTSTAVGQRDWVRTLPSAVEDASLAASALRELVRDAVYLDEEW